MATHLERPLAFRFNAMVVPYVSRGLRTQLASSKQLQVVIPICVRLLSFVRRVACTAAATPMPGTVSNDNDQLELEHTVRRAA
jgi:hypothetical protein